MFKPTVTPKKQAAILQSVRIMGVLAEMICVEYQSELIDIKFKNAIANQRAKNIKASAEGIIRDLSTNPAVNVRFNDLEEIEDYACVMHRVFSFFIGMPIAQVNEIIDRFQKASVQVEEPFEMN